MSCVVIERALSVVTESFSCVFPVPVIWVRLLASILSLAVTLFALTIVISPSALKLPTALTNSILPASALKVRSCVPSTVSENFIFPLELVRVVSFVNTTTLL